MAGKHRKPDSDEMARRGRKAWITPGKRPKLTPSDTDSKLQLPSRIRKKA